MLAVIQMHGARVYIFCDIMAGLEDLHTCGKSKGKPVLMENDGMMNICCGYCHQKVDYMAVFKK